MKKGPLITIVVLLLIIIIGGGYFLLRGNSEPEVVPFEVTPTGNDVEEEVPSVEPKAEDSEPVSVEGDWTGSLRSSRAECGSGDISLSVSGSTITGSSNVDVGDSRMTLPISGSATASSVSGSMKHNFTGLTLVSFEGDVSGDDSINGTWSVPDGCGGLMSLQRVQTPNETNKDTEPPSTPPAGSEEPGDQLPDIAQFDGEWKGLVKSTSSSCSGGTASLDIDNGSIRGTMSIIPSSSNSFNLSARGSVNESGKVSGTASVDGILFPSTFSGQITGDKMEGTWKSTDDCEGTFSLTRE